MQLLASDAVNLSLLTSNMPDSEVMSSNTKLALRVSPDDPENFDLFEPLYEDLIQNSQADRFRQKRGQLVSGIRTDALEVFRLPAAGTEEWSKTTSELLAGK
jgi:hypothetical protein